MRPSYLLATSCLLAGLAPGAKAAQSYDNCTGFIDTLPAIITTQGTWCLRKDLSTAISTGDAIEVATNNVTIDCNHFKLGNLAAGLATEANGIAGFERSNLTVRNCIVRGFQVGIAMFTDNVGPGGSGHLVEGNRVEGSTVIGIVLADSPGSVIRDNRVSDIGGSTISEFGQSYGIGGSVGVDIIGNLVDGVAATPAPGGEASTWGILLADPRGATVAENRVRGIVPTGSNGEAVGINMFSGPASVVGNTVHGEQVTVEAGISCGSPETQVRDNFVMGFALPLSASCTDLGGNTPP